MGESLMLMTLLICIGCYADGINQPVSSTSGTYRKTGTPMHKAVLTQRGYIQFLRWELPVPEINEFTFCVWVKSRNLTYSHSIFSYSKNEKDRLIRAWIAPFGRSINLHINNVEIFSEPTLILENQWYHICQSWDSTDGHYGLWLDGQNKVDNRVPSMAGDVIPGNGDIVLGQEYTDFDKGLEEGIEGSVLGFNLLLVSAFSHYEAFEGNSIDGSSIAPMDYPKFISPSANLNFAASVRYARRPLARAPIGRRVRMRNGRRIGGVPEGTRSKAPRGERSADGPLGLRLIETGYYHCEVGRGSPYIGGNRLLISWTRTPVRVFGGAILKNVDSQCGLFNT